MMRPTLVMFAALAAFPTSCASAKDRTTVQQLPVLGNTPQVCVLQQGRIRTGELVNFRGVDGDALRVLTLIDPATLAVQAARATVLLDAVCNFPHRVRIESQDNGLWPLDGPLAGTNPDFATALPYRLSFVWADQVGQLEADAKIRQAREVRAEIDQPASGELTISIELDAGASNTQLGAPVIAGDYGDTVRIFLEPR